MTTPSLAVHCDACRKKIHQMAPLLIGPPDLSGRVKRFHLCRGCYKWMLENFPALREKARREQMRARAAA